MGSGERVQGLGFKVLGLMFRGIYEACLGFRVKHFKACIQLLKSCWRRLVRVGSLGKLRGGGLRV